MRKGKATSLEVAHLAGGFTAWREAGGPIERVEPHKPKE